MESFIFYFLLLFLILDPIIRWYEKRCKRKFVESYLDLERVIKEELDYIKEK